MLYIEGLHLGVYLVKQDSISLSSFSNVPLNDGGWYLLTLSIQESFVQATISSNGSYCNPFCVVTAQYTADFGNVSLPFSGLLTFGDIGSALNVSQAFLNHFFTAHSVDGCIRNLVYRGTIQTLDDGAISGYPIQVGCPRDQYCVPDPCDNEGLCIASWDGYSCQCGIDYSGNNCTEGEHDCHMMSSDCHF